MQQGSFRSFSRLFLVLVISKNNHYYSIVVVVVFFFNLFFFCFFSCKKQSCLQSYTFNLLHCITSEYTSFSFRAGTLSVYANFHKSWQILSLSVLCGNYFHQFFFYLYYMCHYYEIALWILLQEKSCALGLAPKLCHVFVGWKLRVFAVIAYECILTFLHDLLHIVFFLTIFYCIFPSLITRGKPDEFLALFAPEWTSALRSNADYCKSCSLSGCVSAADDAQLGMD